MQRPLWRQENRALSVIMVMAMMGWWQSALDFLGVFRQCKNAHTCRNVGTVADQMRYSVLCKCKSITFCIHDFTGRVCTKHPLNMGVDTDKQIIMVMHKPQGSKFMSATFFFLFFLKFSFDSSCTHCGVFLSDKYDRCISRCAACSGKIRTS